MKQSKFDPKQIIKLLENKYVVKCSSKAITYSSEFKVFAVKQYTIGKTASQIFREAGFDLNVVGDCVFQGCLRRWRKKFEAKGEVGLRTDERGTTKGIIIGRPKTKGLTDVDQIKRLKIEVAYLKAKNDFLVKLRAQRKS